MDYSKFVPDFQSRNLFKTTESDNPSNDLSFEEINTQLEAEQLEAENTTSAVEIAPQIVLDENGEDKENFIEGEDENE